METDSGRQDVLTLRDYLRVVTRRKWTIAAVAALLLIAALAVSLSQTPLYRSSADVLLARQTPFPDVTGPIDPTAGIQPQRFVNTQAQLARVPTVAKRVVDALDLRTRTAPGLLGSSTVTPLREADLLRFQVTDENRRLAARLATEYAKQFTIYRRQLDTERVEKAEASLTRRIQQLEAAGDDDTQIYASLADRREQLRATRAALAGNAVVVRSATSAVKVQPKPLRAGLLALAIGLILGVLLAFLREALDTRVRSSDEVRSRLGLPLLARLPAPPRRFRADSRLAMLVDPGGVAAEAFRMLRTNFELANLDRGAKSIVVTSAVAGEGKSTTAANLAVALARAGRRVVLVDLDLRRPALAGFFGADRDGPGVTDVALGRAGLDEALLAVSITEHEASTPSPAGNGHAPVHGMLHVLPAGHVPADPGEFVNTRALAGILDELRGRADVILVDTPAVLDVGDAMTLSANVDAVLVVTRLRVVRRPMLAELRRLLDASPAAQLGFVATGAELEDGYRRETPYRRRGRQPAAPTRVRDPERAG